MSPTCRQFVVSNWNGCQSFFALLLLSDNVR